MAEKIEVEWIATSQAMLSAIERINRKIDQQEKHLAKVAAAGTKVGNEVAGSFNKLEQELKDNEAALKRLQIGTKAFAEQKAKVDQLRNALKGAKTELQGKVQEAGKLEAAGTSLVAKVAGFAAGMLTVQKVFEAINFEFEKASRIRLAAAAQTNTLEDSLAIVGQNVGAAGLPEAREIIVKESQRLGTTQEGLAALLAESISAGAKDLKEALKLAEIGLKLTNRDAEKALPFVGGMLDVATLSQSKNFAGAMGQLLQVQSQVRSTNLREFAANIGPGLVAATGEGENQAAVSSERAFEMAATISQLIKDRTGSNTATTMRQFFSRMDSFAPELVKKMDDGQEARVSKETSQRFMNTRSFDERLKLMREDKGLRLQFLETQRESIGKQAVREIIAATPRAVEFEEKARAGISGLDAAAPFFENLANTLRLNTPIITADRQAAANIAQAAVTGRQGMEGRAQQIAQSTIEQVNLSGLDLETQGRLGVAEKISKAAGKTPDEIAIEQLTLAGEQRRLFGMIPMGGQLSEEHRKLLQDQIAAIRALQETVKEQEAAALARKEGQRPKAEPLPAAIAP